MGITHSTARWAAPLSFAIDFAAQQYGMLSSPNMKDIHDAHLSFWSPQPYFIAGFFFPQQLFQLAWLYRLWKLDAKRSERERREVDTMVHFVPYYCVGNLCIACEFSLAEWGGGEGMGWDEMRMKLLTRYYTYSMDDILEFHPSKNRQHLRPPQLPNATLLHIRPPTPHEHPLHLLHPHTHRLQNLRRHRRSRPPTQRLRSVFRPSRSFHGRENRHGFGLWSVELSQ